MVAGVLPDESALRLPGREVPQPPHGVHALGVDVQGAPGEPPALLGPLRREEELQRELRLPRAGLAHQLRHQAPREAPPQRAVQHDAPGREPPPRPRRRGRRGAPSGLVLWRRG